ncbi:hypothetical protein Tsp_03336 [Trichinella spiralis]|uniref:hypothetical protein n=1 Tax=Trichinella spiralis TaxID=6334 RepID=UPI0001EFC9A3|nr:hypothetical protein Tsp_03336 [Trichinella spiralis]
MIHTTSRYTQTVELVRKSIGVNVIKQMWHMSVICTILIVTVKCVYVHLRLKIFISLVETIHRPTSGAMITLRQRPSRNMCCAVAELTVIPNNKKNDINGGPIMRTDVSIC